MKLLPFICRDHTQDQNKIHPDNLTIQNASSSNNYLDEERIYEEQTQNPDVPMEENLDTLCDSFEATSKEIYEELFAEIMRVKISHSLPNEAVDSLLKALTLASKKSNVLFKKKLQEAIENHKSVLLKLELKNQAKD